MKQSIWHEIDKQYKLDKKNHPGYPDHVCAQASLVTAAAGKLSQTAIEKKYKCLMDKISYKKKMEDEAIQVIVQALRFIENLK